MTVVRVGGQEQRMSYFYSDSSKIRVARVSVIVPLDVMRGESEKECVSKRANDACVLRCGAF